MASDPWADPNLSPGQQAELAAHFARMNVNAPAFVPNVHAQPFVPVYGGPSPYGYSMTGHPQMQHRAMYGQAPSPGMHMGLRQPGPPPHHGPYMMSGMHPQPMHPMPVHHHHHQQQQQPPKPIPVSMLEAEQQPIQQKQTYPQRQMQPVFQDSPTAVTPPPQLDGKRDSPPSQTEQGTQGLMSQIKRSSPEPETGVEPCQEQTVDSWEEIADSTSESRSSPLASLSETTEAVKTTESEGQRQKSTKPQSSSSSSLGSGKSEGTSGSNQPSPVLLERSSKAKGEGDSSGGGAKSKAGAVPPPKTEEDKENVNIVFIGHVDAGKSTIGGHVMYLTGQVDKRTLEKYEREAKEKNRETWYLSWALDTNQEERDKGKTVEVGRASFETGMKRFTILDAPGHAGFVPNMISGAAQADIGVLVISARRGEFETGFERRGQTREHAMLAKTAGVKHLIVLINKMDDPTVNWAEERYEECKTKLTPFLKKVGFNPKTDIYFIPVSGLTGANLKDRIAKDVCPWYSGPAFIPYLEVLPPLSREDKGPFRLPIADKYKEMGTVVMGKVESGGVMKGASLLLMPNRVPVEVLSVNRNDEEVPVAYSGDNIKLKLKGVEEEDISPGFVLCDPSSPCHMGQVFDAQIVILEHKSIICAGYSAVLHIHSVVEEVQIKQLMALIDKRTGKRSSQRPRFIKQDQVAIARFQTAGIICLETFRKFPQMARFTLRDEGKTVAIGKVLKLVE